MSKRDFSDTPADAVLAIAICIIAAGFLIWLGVS